MADDIIGRGLVEILPDFKKFGKELATSMKTAAAQITNSVKPIEGAFRDSNGKLRAANGAFIKEYENGWKAAFATVGASMAKVGKGVTVIGIGVAAASVKMAGDFQAETAVLQTAAGETAKGLQTVRKGILNIATGTGTGIKNLTDGMYTVEKAGYRGAAGLMVLKAAAQGAKEENANLADVTNAMTSVMASYHLKATDSVRVMNALKTAAGEGKITMEQFSGALSTVIPIASANKISFGEVGAAIATLTQHGTSANEATQELASTIRNLAAPNNVAIQEMAHFGINAQDVALKLGTDKRGLAGTINLLSTTILQKMGPSGKVLLSAFNDTKQAGDAANLMLSKMPKSLQPVAKSFLDGKTSLSDWRMTLKGLPVDQANLAAQFATLVNKNRGFSDQLKKGGPASKTYTEALKKMSGGAIGLNTILQLTGENSDGLKERTTKVSTSFNHASKDVEGWKITQGLFNTQISRAKETLQVLAIELGTKLIPVIQDVIGWMGKHRQIVLDLILAFGAFLALMSAMYIAQKLYALATGISAVVTGTWTLAMKAGRAMALGTRIELAALWLWQKAQTVATGIATAAQWLWNAAMTANPIALVVLAIAALVAAIVYVAVKTTWFQTAWRVAWDGIKAGFWAAFNFIKDHWKLILAIITGPIGGAVIFVLSHWRQIQNGASDVINWIKKNWPLLLAIITGPVGLAARYVIQHWKSISDGARNAVSTVTTWFHSLPGKITHALGSLSKTLSSAGGDLVNGLISGAKSKFSSFTSWARSAKNAIVGAIKDVFKIASPSKVMMGLGGHITTGLLTGMMKGKRMLGSAVKGLFHSPLDAAKNLLANGVHLSAKWLDKIYGFALGTGGNAPLGHSAQDAMNFAGELVSEFWPKDFATQMGSLRSLWMGESGWNYKAKNQVSGAYGIPQALPARKMASAGSDWATNPRTQIIWGLNYIRSRYGKPSTAYGDWLGRQPHWYDSGGWLPPGLSLTMNGTGKPERIRTAKQEAALGSGGDTYVFNFSGPIGSRAELENWLVKALDTVGRTKRIPPSWKGA